MPTDTRPSWREPALLAVAVLVFAAITAINPADMATWMMETFPIAIVIPGLLLTWRRFPLTPLLYRLMAFHLAILAIGGHYTYAQVPFGFWMQEAFGFARNHYDRLAHLIQGIVPAIFWRELLLRHTPLRRGGWLFFLVSATALAGSAVYEFIEWWAAVLGGSAADAFLGTQGDPWDTQWDMCLAAIGSILAQLAFSRLHDGQLRRFGFVRDGAPHPAAAAPALSGR